MPRCLSRMLTVLSAQTRPCPPGRLPVIGKVSCLPKTDTVTMSIKTQQSGTGPPAWIKALCQVAREFARPGRELFASKDDRC